MTLLMSILDLWNKLGNGVSFLLFINKIIYFYLIRHNTYNFLCPVYIKYILEISALFTWASIFFAHCASSNIRVLAPRVHIMPLTTLLIDHLRLESWCYASTHTSSSINSKWSVRWHSYTIWQANNIIVSKLNICFVQ